MNVIQKMLRDYYEIIEYDLKPRPVVMENIEKVINCGDPSYGGAMYICTHCKNWKFVPFRCHSRFCPTCGNKYAMERTTSMSFKIIDIAFLPLMKISGTSFSMTGLCSTVFFTL